MCLNIIKCLLIPFEIIIKSSEIDVNTARYNNKEVIRLIPLFEYCLPLFNELVLHLLAANTVDIVGDVFWDGVDQFKELEVFGVLLKVVYLLF